MQRHFTITGASKHRKLFGTKGLGTNLPLLVSAGKRRKMHGKGILGDIWQGVKDAGAFIGNSILGNTGQKAIDVAKSFGVDTSKAEKLYNQGNKIKSIVGSRRRRMHGKNFIEDLGHGIDWTLDRVGKLGPIIAGLKGLRRKRRTHGSKRKHK